MMRLILLRLLESYFRHRWLYLTPLVLLLALAAVYQYYSPPTYMSHGTLYVQRRPLITSLTGTGNDGFSWRTPAQATAGDLRELLQTEAFVRSAIGMTNLEPQMAGGREAVVETIKEFREALWIRPLGDNLIEFGAQHEDPAIAQQVATATMSTYVQWKINVDRQESVVARAFFEDLIQPYRQELERARAEMRAYLQANPEPLRGDRSLEERMEIDRLRFAVDEAAKRVTETMQKEENARLAMVKAESEANQTYVLIDGPLLPDRPSISLRRIVRDTGIFAAVGLFLSLLGIVGGALLDRSFRFPVDVRVGLSLPVLAMVPESRMVIPPELRGGKQQAPARRPAEPPPDQPPLAEPLAGTRP